MGKEISVSGTDGGGGGDEDISWCVTIVMTIRDKLSYVISSSIESPEQLTNCRRERQLWLVTE